MRLLVALVLLCGTLSMARADDLDACTKRHAELSKKAETFHGDAQIKRLIDADLRRSLQEQAEGDADECMEALDHAAKLLAGET